MPPECRTAPCYKTLHRWLIATGCAVSHVFRSPSRSHWSSIHSLHDVRGGANRGSPADNLDSPRSSRSDFLPGWGPLDKHPDEAVFEGPVCKQMLDFSWKQYHVRVTAQEVLLARSRSGGIRDRIPLLEIADVELKTSLHVSHHAPLRYVCLISAFAFAFSVASHRRFSFLSSLPGPGCPGHNAALRCSSSPAPPARRKQAGQQSDERSKRGGREEHRVFAAPVCYRHAPGYSLINCTEPSSLLSWLLA